MSHKVLFIAWAGPGHANPLLGAADQVAALGHEVEWLCVTSPELAGEAAKDLGARRFGLHVLPHHPPIAASPGTDDLDSYVEWSKAVHFARLEERVERIRRIIRDVAPDVIAVSGLVYDGVIAAHLEEVPYACLSTELTPLLPPDLHYTERFVAHRLRPARTQAFAHFSVRPEFRCNEALSPHRNLVFTTEAFISSTGTRPVATRLVGPSLPSCTRFDHVGFPWERLAPDKKIVFAALGSQLTFGSAELRAIARSVTDVGAQLVVATGASSVHADRGLAGDVIVVPTAPQAVLLERASAFITHGGANSVMEAMYHGVPLLVLPVRYDQPLNAHFVTRAGVGLSLSPEATRERGCAVELDCLLTDRVLRSRVEWVRASYRAHNGARAAALELLALSNHREERTAARGSVA